MHWETVAAQLHEHREGIGLFLMAAAVSMHEKLPWPFVKIEALEWCYEWLRKTIMTFISFRGPAHSEASAQTEKVTTDAKGNTVATKETISAASTPETPQV